MSSSPSLMEARFADAVRLLQRYEFLPYGATIARRVVDGEWITDDEIAEECEISKHVCPVCGWPQRSHRGPGRIHGNDENTHEQGCSMYAVLHGLDAPRIANDSLPATHPLAKEPSGV